MWTLIMTTVMREYSPDAGASVSTSTAVLDGFTSPEACENAGTQWSTHARESVMIMGMEPTEIVFSFTCVRK